MKWLVILFFCALLQQTVLSQDPDDEKPDDEKPDDEKPMAQPLLTNGPAGTNAPAGTNEPAGTNAPPLLTPLASQPVPPILGGDIKPAANTTPLPKPDKKVDVGKLNLPLNAFFYNLQQLMNEINNVQFSNLPGSNRLKIFIVNAAKIISNKISNISEKSSRNLGGTKKKISEEDRKKLLDDLKKAVDEAQAGVSTTVPTLLSTIDTALTAMDVSKGLNDIRSKVRDVMNTQIQKGIELTTMSSKADEQLNALYAAVEKVEKEIRAKLK